jgi:hypothetical protein
MKVRFAVGKLGYWFGPNFLQRHRAVVVTGGASAGLVIVLPRRVRIDRAELELGFYQGMKRGNREIRAWPEPKLDRPDPKKSPGDRPTDTKPVKPKDESSPPKKKSGIDKPDNPKNQPKSAMRGLRRDRGAPIAGKRCLR